METLKVYGTKNGTEKLLFGMLADNIGCRAMAKRTATEHGYTITKVIKTESVLRGCAEKDVTTEFFRYLK